MSRKAFLIQVELEVQAVTCPGVWLCPNGKVAIQIYMLDSCVQTSSYPATFPIQCKERFLFYKTFYSRHQLNQLEKALNKQFVYVELVQWQGCELGNVLATFQTTLDELLYPSTLHGSIAGVDLDLLMEPTKIFPGTLSPKVEVSTKTTIEETICVCTKSSSSAVIVNPKTLLSSEHKPHRSVPRKVCHSIEYSIRRDRPLKKVKHARPPFRYRKPEEDLINRKPAYSKEPYDNVCCCRKSKSLDERKCRCMSGVRRSKSLNPDRECPCASVRICPCGSGLNENACSVCSKYQGFFQVKPMKLSPASERKQKTPRPYPPRTRLYYADRASCTCAHPLNECCSCCQPQESSRQQSDVEDACDCSSKGEKLSLAQKIHAKLTKTLNAIPRSIECPCYDYIDDYECNCDQMASRQYKNLKDFYGDFYEKAGRALSGGGCLPDCPGRYSSRYS